MGADVLIATPGRLLSHLKVGNLDLSRCSFFVLDEADRMLDMGFVDDIMKIVQQLPQNCQRIMFSATMPKKIRELAVQLLHDPVEVQIAVSRPAEKIRQMAYVCYEPQKLQIIQHIFKNGNLQRVIIFSGKKERVKEVTRKLKSMHINCDQMHSDLSQAERDEAMYRFKAGQTDVLVATDIVARGIDIDDIRLVINYDVPTDSEDYVHRIGRTARADRDGEAITFVSDTDIYRFQSIEHFLGKEVEKMPLPEGLGDAPEYVKRPKKGNTRKGNGRWHSHGHGGHGKKRKGNKSSNSKNNDVNKANSKDQPRSERSRKTS
jgi:superfamily II DNA/RNA helicase